MSGRFIETGFDLLSNPPFLNENHSLLALPCIPLPLWKQYPKSLGKNMGNKLHTLCSYFAMFPPALPHHFIEKYSKEGDIVLDIFSGRGTTILEACAMGRTGIGNDKNPLAYVLTGAKANIPQKGRIVSRLNDLKKRFESIQTNIDIKQEDKNIKMIFHKHTLKQLLYLKNNLDWRRSNVDMFITAMILGIIHGNSKGFLSLSMPNTFSMSPNYIKNFIKKNKLKKPKRNVFELLIKKLERCYQQPKVKGKAYHQDAKKMSKIKDSSVSLIMTSPPYTRVIRYGRFNWIRLWFLGQNWKEVDKKLFFSQSISKYTKFMSGVLKEIKRVLKPEGKAVLVIGDVKNKWNKNKIDNLAEIVWEGCAKPLGFKLVEPILSDVISDDAKVSKIWGAKKGEATKVDRIIVLEA